MKQIIFSKFSNERAREFQIRTDILQDEQGNRYVRKVAATEEAKEHIAGIYNWYNRLKPGYEKAGMRLNQCKPGEDSDYVELEYLTGTTFQDMLDELYQAGKYEELINEIKQFARRVKETGEQKPFVLTEEFKKVFGEPSFMVEKYGCELNNIDLIFPNIIINDGWNVIDYEWSFDFIVPADFIIYRAIHYYFVSSARSQVAVEKVYDEVGISRADRECFKEMERHFQLYILGETFGTNNLYPLIAGAAYQVEDILDSRKKLVKSNRIQVYFDLGNDFNEKDSTWVLMSEDIKDAYEFELKEGTRRVRIDPGEHQGVLNYKLGYVMQHKELKLSCSMNGELISDNHYIFETDDPYLVFEGFEGKTGTFHIEFVYEPMEDSLLDMVAPLVAVRKEKEHIQALYEDISPKYQQSLKLSTEYQMLTGSAFWKVSKPLRWTIDAIKGFFHHHLWLLIGLKNTKRFLKLRSVEAVKEFNKREWELRQNMHVLNEISLVYDLRDMAAQKKEAEETGEDIKFSIIVPLYNTPPLYLRKMIESVLSQTYGNFELCLADGSDRKHRYVGDICREYRFHDKRIVYKKLKKNLGISENTNACLAMATGDYIALFDHDDFLHPSALYRNYEAIKEHGADFIYSDENTFHETIDDAFNPNYKPDFSPDYLRSVNYICHLTVFSRSLYEKVGGFRKEFDGSQDYDMILRLTEQAEKIWHIRQVLYYWRAHSESTAMDIHAKDYCMDAAKRALTEHLKRVGLAGTVEDGAVLSWYRMRYEIKGNPKISIIIPNKDHVDLLSRCITSILEKSTYDNYEIIIVENNSMLKSTFAYYDSLKKDERIKVVTWEKEFNYSAINNFGATFADGEYILLLNNDMEVIACDWLEEMLMFAQREDVGAVGAKLYYPDDTVQHAGVILGIGGVAGHSHKYFKKDEPGYFARLVVAQDLSAVTAACMMMPKAVFDEVGGLDEGYKVAFNDVDLCMKIRRAGYLIVYTPYAELYHYESVSRGSEDTPEKVERFNGEVARFMDRWGKELLAGDPYYNPNLSLEFEDFREQRRA